TPPRPPHAAPYCPAPPRVGTARTAVRPLRGTQAMRPYPAAATPTRRGLWVLGLAVRTERKVFAGALLGSSLYGGMTVGAAWAVGWAPDHVVLPALSAHHADA